MLAKFSRRWAITTLFVVRGGMFVTILYLIRAAKGFYSTGKGQHQQLNPYIDQHQFSSGFTYKIISDNLQLVYVSSSRDATQGAAKTCHSKKKALCFCPCSSYPDKALNLSVFMAQSLGQLL